MIGLTTGRQTSQRLNSLLKELANTIPSSKIIRRGKASLDELTARFLEEGTSHALALYRWHGGPGRVDLFRVERTGLVRMAPSLLIGRVRLRREFPHRERHVAQGITCGSNSSEGTKALWQQLSVVLELPKVESIAYSKMAATFHVSEMNNGSIDVAVTSPPGVREVGPTITITRLLWDLDESKKKA